MSAPTGFVAALKITLSHCGPRASATAFVGSPARVHASASRSASSIGAGLGSKGPIVVSPFTSHCTCPGSSTLPAGNVVPRITRSTWRAITSSLPIPFCTEQTEPSPKACAVAAIAGSVCIDFVATIPSSHGGSSAGVRGRPRVADHLPGAREPEPARVDRVHVVLRQVVRPHLDVVEQREIRREERPDGPAADDADPHRRTPPRAREMELASTGEP